MDSSRLKKVLAGMSAVAISLTQMGSVFAAYSDVSAGVWYEDAVNAFVDAGYLDATQTKFRGGDMASRAELVKLIVELNGGILSTPPAVASFNDVSASAWYYGYMEEAAKEGWVKGDGACYGSKPCYARPNANVNRAEAAALIERAFALDPTGDAPQFVDNPTGQWYTDSIQTVADHCVLQGDDSTGRVRPSDNMNRAEMVVMLHRVDQNLVYGDDCGGTVTPPPTGAASLKDAVATGATTVTLDFTANLDQASAETVATYKVTAGTTQVTVSSAKLTSAKSVELTLGADMDSGTTYTVTVTDLKTVDGDMISDSATFKGFSAVVKGNGVLEVSVSSKNHAGDSVAKGANGVSMLTLDLTASCDDAVVIEDITALHEGFGASTDIDGLYASMDGARISRKRTIDTKDQSATVHLTTPLSIAACKTVTVDLMADISTTATTAAEHSLVVELPSDILSNAKQVKGNFPLKGNTFRIASVTAGAVSVKYLSVSPTSVKVGDKGALLGKFEFSVNNVEDATIYDVTLEQNGTAHDGDVTNLAIKRSDGTILTNTVAATKNDFATFTFNPPFVVKQGDRITLSVIGDVVGGATNTVILHFDESSDIFAVGSLYGYGVNGQLYGTQITLPATDNSASTGTVTIDAGQLTIEINGPAQQTYTRDQNDATLAKLIFTTGGDTVDMRKLYIAIQGNNSTGGTLASSNGNTSYDNIHEVLKNVTLKNSKTGRGYDATRLTGTTEFGVNTGTSTGTFQIYRFDDISVTGQEMFTFDVDFIDNGASNSPKDGDQYKIHICGEPQQVSTGTNTAGCTFGGMLASTTSYNAQLEGRATGDNVTDVRPRGAAITGNAHRISNASLTVAVKSIGTGDTAVKNSKNVNLFRFEARAGSAKDLLLTKLIFLKGSGSLQNGQNYTLWVDTDANGAVDTILEKGLSAQGSTPQVTFNKLTGGGFVIPKEKTVVFEVHADIVASLNGDDLLMQFDTTAGVTYIEAEDVVRGSSLSGIKTNGTCSGSCDITVTTVTSKNYHLVSQGDLFVTKDSVQTTSHQCLGGTLCDPVLRLQFHAENEPIDVKAIQLTSSGSKADSVDFVELWKEGETVPFATASVGGCGSDRARSYYHGTETIAAAAFCAKMDSQQLVIPKGADVKVVIRPRMKTDINGAASSGTVQFFIDPTAASNNATGSGAIRANGSSSSNDLTANGGNATADGEIFIGTSSATTNSTIRGEVSVAVLAKIASITNASTDANGTQIPTSASPIGKFKITAAANGNTQNGTNKVVLSGVVFNINATNVALEGSGFKLYVEGTQAKQTCTAYRSDGTTQIYGNGTYGSASGSFVVDCRNLVANALINVTVDQGQSVVFVLEGNVKTAQITNVSSTLQVSIQNFNNILNSQFGGQSTRSHFQWLDQDSNKTVKFQWVESTLADIKSTSYSS